MSGVTIGSFVLPIIVLSIMAAIAWRPGTVISFLSLVPFAIGTAFFVIGTSQGGEGLTAAFAGSWGAYLMACAIPVLAFGRLIALVEEIAARTSDVIEVENDRGLEPGKPVRLEPAFG